MARLREAIETAQVRETELVAETTACRVALASTIERVEELGVEHTRIDGTERDLTARIDQARARQAQLTDRRAWLAEERERTDASAREIAVERDRMDVEVRQAAEGHEGLAEQLRAIEADQRAVDGDLGRLVASIHEIDLGATECRVRREELAQEAWRAYGVDEAALAARHDPSGDLETVRGRIVELVEKVAAIGPVNLVADDEYRELDVRTGILHTHHDDLVGSTLAIDTVMLGLSRT